LITFVAFVLSYTLEDNNVNRFMCSLEKETWFRQLATVATYMR